MGKMGRWGVIAIVIVMVVVGVAAAAAATAAAAVAIRTGAISTTSHSPVSSRGERGKVGRDHLDPQAGAPLFLAKAEAESDATAAARQGWVIASNHDARAALIAASGLIQTLRRLRRWPSHHQRTLTRI